MNSKSISMVRRRQTRLRVVRLILCVSTTSGSTHTDDTGVFIRGEHLYLLLCVLLRLCVLYKRRSFVYLKHTFEKFCIEECDVLLHYRNVFYVKRWSCKFTYFQIYEQKELIKFSYQLGLIIKAIFKFWKWIVVHLYLKKNDSQFKS